MSGSGVFEHFGLDPGKFPKRLIGSETGDLLIIGGARCVWEDVRGLPFPSAVMAVNDIGMYWPGPLKHWYSNDTEQLDHWFHGRRRSYVREHGNARLHSCFKRDTLPHINHWPFPGQGGSGLAAILVALALGYSPITVGGMPFDNSGHFFDPPHDHNLRKDRLWSDFKNETPDRILMRALPLFKGRVTALSGRLGELLNEELNLDRVRSKGG